MQGCGHEGYTLVGDCVEVYSEEFCDSIRGQDGESGDRGSSGTDGLTGRDGIDGEQGTQGIQGEVGPSGENGEDAIVEIIDPCGQETTYDEVLVRFSNDLLYAVYYDGTHAFFAELVSGTYITTDGTDCKFEVTEEGDVIW